jgi:hypothetical protein
MVFIISNYARDLIYINKSKQIRLIMVKIKHEIASINQNKQMSIFSIIVLISISFVFLMSAISFTVDSQNVLAQNSVNVFP